MNIVVLSGAGLSAESGIETFRGNGGLWDGNSVDDVATLNGFTDAPAFVHEFYNMQRRRLKDVNPNAAHFALAELEKSPGVEFTHVTQNIDDLCERAGAENMIHMHGELLKCRCLRCSKIILWDGDTSIRTICPECGSKSEWGGLRPHIVWFGEVPLHMKEIDAALKKCDLFVAVGTSGKVHPAAGFVRTVKESGARTFLLNKDSADNDAIFDETILGAATEIVPRWVDQYNKSLGNG
ncbi:MAG: NAD-dependent deacylase [Victivallales bacterium]|nr:NAD-dependent deacylase [Victivallales bacterium]